MTKPILYTDEPMVVGDVIPDFPRPDQLAYPPKRRKYRRMQIAEDKRIYDEAKKRDEEFFPADLIKKIFAGQSPIRVYRTHRGLTQQALADGMGISRAYLAEIESGKKTGSVRILNRAAKILAVDLDMLVVDQKSHENKP
ncbi:MAG: helix-turn-helix domain-containing protein, partial [Alphaproteobacteria bacterium]